MNVALAAQMLSGSTCQMIRDTILDNAISPQIRNKNRYHHLANLCDHWDQLLNVTNGRDGPHTPENAIQRQTELLDILDWFSKWEELHKELLDKGEAPEFSFLQMRLSFASAR